MNPSRRFWIFAATLASVLFLFLLAPKPRFADLHPFSRPLTEHQDLPSETGDGHGGEDGDEDGDRDSGVLPSSTNSTLGFGGIFVLSNDTTSWRIQGLRKAAALTGVELTVPDLNPPQDERVHAAVVGGDPAYPNGPDVIRASYNHVALLKEFLRSGQETALILEDDVDFDVNIGAQVSSLAVTLQVDATGTGQGCTASSDPYCHEAWDILWLGHCGMQFTTRTTVLDYEDPFALDWDHLTCPFNNYYEQQKEGHGSQQIVRGVAPLCTYAYAVTRKAALDIVEHFPERPKGFDMERHVSCMGGRHNCIAPVPELFHHQTVLGERKIGEKGDDVIQDLDWYKGKHKFTYNVQWSARCNALGVGEHLVGGWQCLPGKYDT
ncbi:hypothetical protein LTR15_006438 [Elasticomyces elasticus]|nr:hypothetical protein LTR15_006438 [Elasticomyces elasticus]